MTLERYVTTFPAATECRAEHAIGGIEALGERREIALPQIRLRQAFRRASRRKQCNQLVDNELLPTTLPQCLALSLLKQQDVRKQAESFFTFRQTQPPL